MVSIFGRVLCEYVICLPSPTSLCCNKFKRKNYSVFVQFTLYLLYLHVYFNVDMLYICIYMFISIVMCLFMAAIDLPRCPGTEPPSSHWPLVSWITVSTIATFSRNLTPVILNGFLYCPCIFSIQNIYVL